MKRKLTAAILAAMMLCMQPFPALGASDGIFYDDFNGSQLSTERWLIAEKNWGGTVSENGKTVDYNGGVIAENVSVQDGRLLLTGYGNRYDGAVRGINRDGSRRDDGKRCGAAIATKDYFGSGRYEIRAKIAPELGCCSAMWTFEYEEDYSGDALSVTNHEIDIEFPGRDADDAFSLSHALCTTWVTEDDYKTKSVSCGDQADGQFHTYRFDWHTGSATETPRVEYYFDDKLTHTAYDYIPTNAGRFWLGLWFPKNWAGTPDFEKEVFEIDYAIITPFHESGDTPQNETYPDDGWAEPTRDVLPDGWLLWHRYSSYEAEDGRLFLRAPDSTVTEITGDFYHAINGSFGTSPDQFTFMAIDNATKEWDIYYYDRGTITNLTPDSGYINEDPKLSPDGTKIVFKRGLYDWKDGITYNLAMYDLATKEITMLTNDSAEEAMPCFSSDGAYICFAKYKDNIGSIMRMKLADNTTETVFSEPTVNAYYPIEKNGRVYFSAWWSTSDHTDQILCMYRGKLSRMPFDTTAYNCSDACPVSDTEMIYSATKDGTYDLYYFDGTESHRLDALCSDTLDDLGAAFFPLNMWASEGSAYMLQDWLLRKADKIQGIDADSYDTLDFDHNHRLDAVDLTLMKQSLLQ